jgi:predicted ABC-type ATPase
VQKYSNINYLDKEKQIADKAIAKGLKDTVETYSNEEIGKINAELSQWYTLQSYLEKINNKKVEGGRLGKYFAKTIGAIVGAKFGPLGSIAGSELAGGIKGSQMASKLSKTTGREIEQSPIIQGAVNKAGSPRLQLSAPTTNFRTQKPSGNVINLPSRSQSTIDNQSNILGNRQINQATTIIPTNKFIPKVSNEEAKMSSGLSTTLKQDIADSLYGNGAKKKERRIDIITGLPASGKSSLAEKIAKENGAIIIDSDMAKPYLPGWNGGKGASNVQEASSDTIDNFLLPKAMQNQDNIVLPVVGKNLENLKNRIAQLREAGYSVHLKTINAPQDVVLGRVKERAIKSGREVPLDYVKSIGDKPSQNFNVLKKSPDIVSFEKLNSTTFPPRTVQKNLSANKLSGKDLAQIVEDINNGGISYNLAQKASLGGTKNYAVSLYPERSVILDKLSTKDIVKFIKSNSDLLSQKGHILGGWYDTETGKIYLDVSTAFKNKEKAIELGKEFNQKAIFDLKNFSDIPTGGTGENTGGLPPIKDRLKSIARLFE